MIARIRAKRKRRLRKRKMKKEMRRLKWNEELVIFSIYGYVMIIIVWNRFQQQPDLSLFGCYFLSCVLSVRLSLLFFLGCRMFLALRSWIEGKEIPAAMNWNMSSTPCEDLADE
jgi:hypothetical protein